MGSGQCKIRVEAIKITIEEVDKVANFLSGIFADIVILKPLIISERISILWSLISQSYCIALTRARVGVRAYSGSAPRGFV